MSVGDHQAVAVMPAEWEMHRAVWVAWPEGEELWGGHLSGAREEWLGLCRAIAAPYDSRNGREEVIEVLVRDPQAAAVVTEALAGASVTVHVVPYGDVWLRDTAPLFCRGVDGARVAVRFEFNGWGEKYVFADDPELAARLAEHLGVELVEAGVVLEGGALEVDGEGTLITTVDCALNSNRNPRADAAAIESALERTLGVRTTLWLHGRLARDHTDGHVDTLARFAAPGRVLCMVASDSRDPNREVLRSLRAQLSAGVDAAGRRLEVVEIPSPGRVDDDDGLPLPASYLNYYISNAAVVVPVYGSEYDSAAVDALASCFADRPVIAAPARHILTGGGAFHCVTQQEPLMTEDRST
ncbi:MAG: agmatine deiminase family protein [Candidatus Binatia bacterium]